MAKPKDPAREEIVETLQDQNFADAEPERLPPRGEGLAADMQAIRDARARARNARGPVTKRRVLTNYHDAERLNNLVTGIVPGNAGHRDSFGRVIKGSENKFPELATAEELVDAEEAGLLPNPEHYATGSTMLPPDEGV